MDVVDNPGCISDSLGNILFYCNGETVWNRNHTAMQNGTGLLGSTTGGQAATIVRKPGSFNLYYIFTMDAFAGSNGLRYSVVDMSLANGLGAVVANQKNIVVLNPAAEQVIPIVHSNGVDIWIVGHQWGTNQFNAYLLTASGLSTTPVTTAVGVVRSGNTSNAMGQISVNKANNTVATTINQSQAWELYHFHNDNGTFSHPITFQAPEYTNALGVEFSPDGKKVYITEMQNKHIYQFDISNHNSASINATRVDLGTVQGPHAAWDATYMQVAPDNKIYIGVYNDTYAAVINNPNATGVACNLVDDGFYLGGKTNLAGLPNKILLTSECIVDSVYLGSDTILCNGQSMTLTAPAGASYRWSNDSITSTINISSAGTYSVTVTEFGGCTITGGMIVSTGNTNGVFLGPDTSFCSSSPYILNATQPGSTYQWSNGATTPFIATTTAGMYSVTVTGANGCPVADSIYLAIAPPLTATFQVTQPSCGNNNGVLTCLGINGFAPINVQWNTGGNNIGSTYQVSNLSAGTYYFNAIDAIGCTIDTSFVLVNTVGAGTVSISSSADTICGGGVATICAPSGFTSYQWNNGETTQCITTRIAGSYYVTVTDAGNCTASSVVQAIYAHPLPPVSVTINVDTMTAYNGVTYQWYFNGEAIAGATGSQYVATQNGNYAVVITDVNGCGASSNTIGMVRTDMGITIERDIVVYPNPNANGTWYVQLSNDMFGANAEVYDYSGKLVYDAALLNNINPISFDAASGIYVLKLTTGSNTITKKLIKL